MSREDEIENARRVVGNHGIRCDHEFLDVRIVTGVNDPISKLKNNSGIGLEEAVHPNNKYPILAKGTQDALDVYQISIYTLILSECRCIQDDLLAFWNFQGGIDVTPNEVDTIFGEEKNIVSWMSESLQWATKPQSLRQDTIFERGISQKQIHHCCMLVSKSESFAIAWQIEFINVGIKLFNAERAVPSVNVELPWSFFQTDTHMWDLIKIINPDVSIT